VPQKESLEYAIKMTRENPEQARVVFREWLDRGKQFWGAEYSPVVRVLEEMARTDIAAAIAVYWWDRVQYTKATRGNLTG